MEKASSYLRKAILEGLFGLHPLKTPMQPTLKHGQKWNLDWVDAHGYTPH